MSKLIVAVVLFTIGVPLLIRYIIIPEAYGIYLDRRRLEVCNDHLARLLMDLHAYAHDHKGHFPKHLAILMQDGYEQEFSPFICPFGLDAPPIAETRAEAAKLLEQPGHISYLYFGVNLTEDSPPNSIVLADRPENNDRWLFMSGGHIEYLSGKIVFVDTSQLKTILASLQTKEVTTTTTGTK